MKFKAEWEISDGYVGKSRPQSTLIDDSDIEDDMDENALRELLYACIQEDFEQKISWGVKAVDEEKFIVWAKERMDAIIAEEDA